MGRVGTMGSRAKTLGQWQVAKLDRESNVAAEDFCAKLAAAKRESAEPARLARQQLSKSEQEVARMHKITVDLEDRSFIQTQ